MLAFQRAMLQLWLLATHPIFTIKQTPITLVTAIGLLVVVLGTFRFASWVEGTLTRHFFNHFQLDSGLVFTLGRLVQYGVIAVGLYLGLQLVGIDLGAVAVLFGFLSIGIGFGLQNVTSNFVSGLIIMFERPIAPGDRVTVGDNVGQVKAIRLRSTTIETNVAAG